VVSICVYYLFYIVISRFRELGFPESGNGVAENGKWARAPSVASVRSLILFLRKASEARQPEGKRREGSLCASWGKSEGLSRFVHRDARTATRV
jgi:hypothetical protein